MRTSVTVPTIATIRQHTMMKNGLRIEKPDISSLLRHSRSRGATSFGCTFSPSRYWLRFPMTTRSPSFNPETTSTRDFP